jgi:predicted DNA-binding ArsR family transcriptional regulator
MDNQFEKMQKLAFGKVVQSSTPETLTEGKGALKNKIKEIIHSTLGEAKKKKKEEEPTDVAPQEDVDIDIDAEETPAPDETSTDDTLAPSDSSDIDIDPKVKSVQDYLQKAYANAKELGDEKLMTQIGNTITMVVRNQVLGGQAVAESLEEMEDTYSSSDKLSNNILNNGIGNKDRGTVFFEAWHLATNSDMTDEEAWNVYTKGDVNIKESLNEEDDIFDGSYKVSEEAYERMDNLVNQPDYMNFINSADKIMRNLVSEGFEVKDIYYYLYTRLLADI